MGYSALPYVVNDYLPQWQTPIAAAGVLKPKRAAYDIVFDSATASRAGRFHFHFWLNDTRPPTVRLLTRTVPRGSVLRLSVTDAGSGVWPASIVVLVDGSLRRARYSAARHRATIPIGGLARGKHRLVFGVADFQESRNDENVGPILQNTRRFSARFRVR
jgi:hypothetical protein